MAINYFFRTSAKEWDIAEAIINYDQEDSTPEMSLDQLLLKIKSDLKTIGKTQASLNRYALRAVAQVDVSKSWIRFCLKKTIDLCLALRNFYS